MMGSPACVTTATAIVTRCGAVYHSGSGGLKGMEIFISIR